MSNPTPAPLSSIEQLTHSTVRLEAVRADGSVATGSGFFFQFHLPGGIVPVVLTNKHVVEHGISLRLALTLQNAEGRPDVGNFRNIQINDIQRAVIPHPDPNVDLCAFPIAQVLNELGISGQHYFLVCLDKSLIPSADEFTDLSTLEEILMIGYPNGIWDSANNMPILRRGITATHAALNFQHRQEFVIDAACFPGSSGSPVFIYNAGAWIGKGGFNIGGDRVKLLGLLYAGPQHTATGDVRVVTIPTNQRTVSVSTIPNNLGYVVRASRILELEAAVQAFAESH